MKKKLFSIIMCLVMVICFMPSVAFANSTTDCTDTCEHVAIVTIDGTTTHYGTLQQAINAARAVGANQTATITLLKDVSDLKWTDQQSRDYWVTKWIVGDANGGNVGNTVILDLNGHDISLASGGAIQVRGGKFEIKGKGTIKEADFYRAPIVVYGSTNAADATCSTLIVGKDVTLEGYCGVQVRSDSETYNGYGINITVNGTLIGHTDAQDSSDAGAGIEIKSELSQTEGNVPQITLDGAAIRSDGTGIYAAGYAQWTLTDTTINGNTPIAMDIRSGKFTINSGEYYSVGAVATDINNLVATDGTINTGAVINLINQTGYAGKIDVTISGGTFNSTNGYAIYQGSVDSQNCDAGLTINDGNFSGKEGALYLKNLKQDVVKKGTFSSDPTTYVTSGQRVTNANGIYYVTDSTDSIRIDDKTTASVQGIKIAPMTDTSYSVNEIKEYKGQTVSITVAPTLHKESDKSGKWVGIAVPVPDNTSVLSYELSSGEKVDGQTTGNGEIGTTGNDDVVVKKVTIDDKEYIGFYWDYDDKVVSSVKYKFSKDDSTNQYNQVFIDITAVPGSVSLTDDHAAGTDACIYNVNYADGIATVNYCGLGENAQAKVRIPVEYLAKKGETTYLYYKYDNDTNWTMENKGTLSQDGNYYECNIDLKDNNSVTLQYKYGPVISDDGSTILIDSVLSGVYTLKVTAKKADGQTAENAQHSWNDGVITTQPTTTSTGIKTYTCTRCQATKTETIAKKPSYSGGGIIIPSGSVSSNTDTSKEDKSDGSDIAGPGTDELISGQTEKVKGLLDGLKLKLTSSKTKKGNIYTTLKVNTKTIKSIKDLGYTVKYKFYRRAKASAKYTGKALQTRRIYVDKTGKKGTKYYYTARVMVYDKQGNLVAKTLLKQCTGTSRVK